MTRRRAARLATGFLGTLLALLLTSALLRATDHPWLLPSFGGSCVILFGMSRGIMAQPRSFLGGHVLATLVGLGMRGLSVWLGGPQEVWAAAAVAAALTAMALTRTIHSPAGANPLVVFAEGADWHFLLSPLLPGLALLFGVAALANNLPAPWGVPPWPRFFWSRFMPRGVRGRLARLHRRRP